VINPIVKEDLDHVCDGPIEWSELSNKKVVVSGANGMLAAYLVRSLLYAESTGRSPGLEVVVLVRDADRAERNFAPWSDDRRTLKILGQDVCDPVPADLHADYVVHAASAASPARYMADPAGTLLANTLGTFRMLDLARRSGTSGFLFLSSGAVYGLADDEDMLITEQSHGVVDPLDERSCYAEGKRAGEAMCAAWWRQYEVRTSIVRISHTYGPGMDLDDGRVFSDFVRDILADRDIVMKSAGTDARPFCYISDATRAFLMLLLRGQGGQAYNMGMDRETTISDLAKTLVGLFPERGLRVVRQDRQQRGAARSSGVFDLSKISELGWKPEISLEDGFRRTVRYFEIERQAAGSAR
jgi:UDP-glucuronate decarboxylase